MNEEFVKAMGFGKLVEDVKAGKCAFCGKKIDPSRDFRDELSAKEYGLSGMCQDCQDEVFG